MLITARNSLMTGAMGAIRPAVRWAAQGRPRPDSGVDRWSGQHDRGDRAGHIKVDSCHAPHHGIARPVDRLQNELLEIQDQES